MLKPYSIVLLLPLLAAALPVLAANRTPQSVHEGAVRSIAVEAAAQEEALQWQDERAELSTKIRDMKLMEAWLEFQTDKYERYIAKQQETIAELEHRKEEARRIGMELEPYLETVADLLEAHIAADLPFLPEERTRRMAFLRESLDDYHLDLSEKLRRVLEALHVETEYGRNVETTSRELPLGGVPTRVTIVRLGRSALYYLAEDGSAAGTWDRATRSWQPIETKFVRTLTQARDMAERKRAIDLLVLPVGGAR